MTVLVPHRRILRPRLSIPKSNLAAFRRLGDPFLGRLGAAILPWGIGGGKAAVPVPLQIPDLDLWLRADAITGLADGDPVTTWSDESGQGNDATEAANPPTLQTAEVNGLNAVEFDGINQILTGPPMGWGGSFSIWIVVEPLDATANFFILENGQAATSNANFYLWWNGANMVTGFFDGVAFRDHNTPLALVNGVAFLLGIVFDNDGNTIDSRIDGVASSEPEANGNPTVAGAQSMFYASGRNGGFKSMQICEVVGYPRPLDGSEVGELESYLATRWGISI